MAAEHADDDLDDGEHDQLEQAHRQARAAGERQRRSQWWRARSAGWLRSGRRLVQLLAMTHPGRRSDDHPGPADVHPPAQVDVVAVEADRRVEPAEGAEQVGPHEQAGRRDGEHVGDGVVLLLVDLADVGDRLDRFAEAVDVETDVLQDAGRRPR